MENLLGEPSVDWYSKFDEHLESAVRESWWRMFVEVVTKRRLDLMEELASGSHDQRADDRIRGEISGLSFILILDLRGNGLVKARKEGKDGRESAASSSERI